MVRVRVNEEGVCDFDFSYVVLTFKGLSKVFLCVTPLLPKARGGTK